MLFYTDRARLKAIDEIKRLIAALGQVKSGDLPYTDYKGIVRFLTEHINVIESELNKDDSETL